MFRIISNIFVPFITCEQPWPFIIYNKKLLNFNYFNNNEGKIVWILKNQTKLINQYKLKSETQIVRNRIKQNLKEYNFKYHNFILIFINNNYWVYD